MDLAPNQAVHPDMSGAADPGQAGLRHGEGGLIHDLAADEQDLRQYEHNQNHGDDGAPTKALADADDGRMRGHHANQDARAGQNGAGGQDRGEGDVHGFDDGFFVRHLGFQLLIAAGNHDGVVDIRAHLNRADHQIAQEEQGRLCQSGISKVNPDGTLDHENQQDGHTRGLEGEQQHHQHNQNGNDGNNQIIRGEGGLEVLIHGGVAHQVQIPVRIVGSGDFPDLVQEIVGGVPVLGKGQINQHPVIILTLKLLLRGLHLHLGILQIGCLLVVQCHKPLVNLIADKEHHVDERHLVIVKTADDLGVFVLIGGIGGVHHLGYLIVQARQLRKLPGVQLIGQHIAVHGLHVGKPLAVVHLIVGVQLGQHFRLYLIVRLGIDQRHEIVGAKVVGDFILSHLDIVQLRRGNAAQAIGIGAVIGKMETDHYQRQENRRDEETGLIVECAHKGDLRNEVLMLGFLHPRPEEHQEAGHEHKHGKQGKQHGFNQVDGHIRADLELHEHHGDQAADGGQAAGADFRNALAQGGDGRLPDGQTVLPLLLEPVAQNDRVVQGQRQL